MVRRTGLGLPVVPREPTRVGAAHYLLGFNVQSYSGATPDHNISMQSGSVYSLRNSYKMVVTLRAVW